MSLLVESIRAFDGVVQDLEPHIQRMRRSRRELWDLDKDLDLKAFLDSNAERFGPGLWKVRVLYDRDFHRLEASPYRPKSYFRVAIVQADDVEYSHKWAERPVLDELNARAVSRGADTALIVKNGLVTDFSYANAAFFDGSKWWTPSRPLLLGTRRQRLLESGRINTADIPLNRVSDFSRLCPINAMLDLDDVCIESDQIILSERTGS